MNKKVEKVLFISFVIIVHILQLLLVLVLVGLNNGWFNFLYIIIAFIPSRSIFGKTYHAENIFKCTVLTLISFHILLNIGLPLNISILNWGLLGISFSFILSYANKFVEANKGTTPITLILESQNPISTKNKKTDIKKELRDIVIKNGKTITEKSFQELCLLVGMTTENGSICYDYLNKTKNQICLDYHIGSPVTVYNISKKFIEKMNKVNDNI